MNGYQREMDVGDRTCPNTLRGEGQPFNANQQGPQQNPYEMLLPNSAPLLAEIRQHEIALLKAENRRLKRMLLIAVIAGTVTWLALILG